MRIMSELCLRTRMPSHLRRRAVGSGLLKITSVAATAPPVYLLALPAEWPTETPIGVAETTVQPSASNEFNAPKLDVKLSSPVPIADPETITAFCIVSPAPEDRLQILASSGGSA